MLRRWVSCVKELTELGQESRINDGSSPKGAMRVDAKSAREAGAEVWPRAAREAGAEVWPRGAREAGERGKPMAQAVGIGCERSVSPRSGRKVQVRSGDFSVAKSVVLGTERTRCRPSALPTDTQRPGPDSFARFAGFILFTACSPRLAPWAFIFRPLRGLAPPTFSQIRYSPTAPLGRP